MVRIKSGHDDFWFRASIGNQPKIVLDSRGTSPAMAEEKFPHLRARGFAPKGRQPEVFNWSSLVRMIASNPSIRPPLACIAEA